MTIAYSGPDYICANCRNIVSAFHEACPHCKSTFSPEPLGVHRLLKSATLYSASIRSLS